MWFISRFYERGDEYPVTPELEAAIAAARAAGELLWEEWGTAHQIRHKGPADLVTEMDQQAQDLIASMLREPFPAYGLMGEEGDGQFVSDNPRWLVDPLDGTTNYARGYPFFAVSIALERDDEIVLGVVYNPVLDELFVAEQGGGATLNGNPIHVSTRNDLGESLLASGFPYNAWTSQADNGQEWQRFIKRALSLRSDGSAALDLCHVAMGRIDGFWELELGPWDMAAGALIVQESGGKVSQVNGDPFTPYGRGLLASNGHLHAEMLAVLRES
jgi:myo-inositol-1(or 4)-monophosphatase